MEQLGGEVAASCARMLTARLLTLGGIEPGTVLVQCPQHRSLCPTCIERDYRDKLRFKSIVYNELFQELVAQETQLCDTNA